MTIWRAHFKKMAAGQIPYTRDFTVVTSGKQVGRGYVKDMEKLINISPATAAAEIAASSAEGNPYKKTSTVSNGKGVKKKTVSKTAVKPISKKNTKKQKMTGNRPEYF